MSFNRFNKYRAEKVALAYFIFAMLWILTSDYVLRLLVSDPSLLVSLSTFKGILFVSTTALLLYLILRVWILKPETKPLQDQSENRRGLMWVFAGMALLVPLLSISMIQISTPQAIKSARTHIEMVAVMKADYLDQWLVERAHLADMIALDKSLINWIAQWDDPELQIDAVNQLTGYINRLQANDHYDGVYLYNVERDQALSSGIVRYRQEALEGFITAAQATNEPFFAGVSGVENQVNLSWVVPVYASRRDDRPVAVLILSSDPAQHLYPNLETWPTESHSAELFLLENADTTDSRLLSPLKFSTLRPLSAMQYTGDQGVSYQGEEVIGVLQPLTQVNWSLAAQQSRQEVLAPVYMLAAWLGLLSLATVISVMFALRLVWQKNRRLHHIAYQMQAAEKDRLLLRFFEMPFVGMAIIDPDSGRWLRFNPELCRLLGYTESELKELTWQEVTHPDDLYTDEQAFQSLHEGSVDCYTLEKQYLRQDGSVFTALLNVGAVRFADGRLQYCMATLQDITDQKRYESDILHQRDLYNTLSETNQAIIRCKSKAQIFSEVCRIAVVFGQLGFACVVEVLDQKVRLLECYGQQPDALGLSPMEWFPLAPDSVYQQVIRSGHPQISNQLEHQTSQACFPVMLDHQVIALLNFYADEMDFFSPDVVATLSEMMSDIGFAIRFLEQENALKAAVQVVEASPVVLFRWDNLPGWPVTYVSANVSRWGYAADEFLSGNIDFKQLVHPDDCDWLEQEIIFFLSQRRDEYHQEYRLITRDGQVLWVEDMTKVVYHPDGSVDHIEGVVTDVTSRKTVQQRIEFLSRHDALTGLPNRPDILTSIETRGNELTALLMLDLDRFKDVNDSFGHRIGDQLLCRVADELRKVCPDDALLARFGGDEFGVLIDRDPDLLKALAAKLIQALRTPIQLPEGMEIRIGACVGIARFEQANSSAEELLRQADAALYKAKEAGREQLCFYTDELTEAALVRLNTEARLREAIKQGHLEVYYQPQIDIATGQLIGAEALLRWHDASHFISPDQFIPVAEQSGLIHPMGEWVMDQVCQTGRRWLDLGYAPLTLAVNLSSFQLRHGDVVSMIRETLSTHHYPASGLEVELTESALMRREDEAEKIFDELQSMGVSLAIDDFGTGYSSLSYLKNFPLNVLKIDKSFVEDLETSADDREIAAAIIVMGHTLGLKIIAEGVETPAQLQQLKDLGCDFYQGYYTSRALPADEFERVFLASMASPQGLEPRSDP